jgi:hypothetical protein
MFFIMSPFTSFYIGTFFYMVIQNIQSVSVEILFPMPSSRVSDPDPH